MNNLLYISNYNPQQRNHIPFHHWNSTCPALILEEVFKVLFKVDNFTEYQSMNLKF